MTYKTFPRTRQAVYAFTFFFGAILLAAAAARWLRDRQTADLLLALWVLSVAWSTITLLRGLERLERVRREPDEAMELVLYAASLLPLAGYFPLLARMGWG